MEHISPKEDESMVLLMAYRQQPLETEIVDIDLHHASDRQSNTWILKLLSDATNLIASNSMNRTAAFSHLLCPAVLVIRGSSTKQSFETFAQTVSGQVSCVHRDPFP